jgi:hypothetical protein
MLLDPRIQRQRYGRIFLEASPLPPDLRNPLSITPAPASTAFSKKKASSKRSRP